MIDTSPPAKGNRLIIFEWCFFALTLPFVGSRLYSQPWQRNRPWQKVLPGECFLIIACLANLGFTLVTTMMNVEGFFRYQDHTTLPADQVLKIGKAFYSFLFVYPIILNACKAALLGLCLDLTPRAMFPKTWWTIVITCVITGAAQFVIWFNLLFPCQPYSIHYTGPDGGCWVSLTFLLFPWVLNLQTDVLVHALPFFILGNVTHRVRKQMAAAYVMFGMGFFNIISAVFVLLDYSIWINSWRPLANRSFAVGLEWAEDYLMAFQSGTAIIIICIPYCRRLVMRRERVTDSGEAVEQAAIREEKDPEAAAVRLASPSSEGKIADLKDTEL